MDNRETLSRAQYIISTLAIENLAPSDFALELCSKMDNGEYKIEDAISAVLKRHNLQRAVKNG